MTWLKDVTVKADEGTENVRIPMERGGIVFVKGILPGDLPEGRPQIQSIHAYEADGERDVVYIGVKQPDDTYRFDLAPGQYQVNMNFCVVSDPGQPSGGEFCQTIPVAIAAGESKTVDLTVGGRSVIRGTFTTPDGEYRLAVTLRRGAHDTPVPEVYANTRPSVAGGCVPNERLFAIAFPKPEYGVGCLEAGTYTVTALAYDEATEEIRQQSKVVTLSDGEVATADFAF